MSRSIFVRQLVPATIEELWAACSTAQGMASWQADEVVGDAARADRITLSWPALKLSLELTVKEVVPQQRITFGVGASQLTVELEPGAVSLTHVGLHSDDEAEGMRSAWQTSLGLLAHALVQHPGRTRRVHWITRPARTTAALAHVYFSEPMALSQWLTRAGSVGAVGSNIALQLMTGEVATGVVHANAVDRDVAFSWIEQQNSYVVFRTFPSPRASDERLLAIAWSRWHSEAFPEPTAQFLNAALGRLAHLLERRGLA
ncbi:MAG TPA: SRPBCC domain-containing protein [Polyangiaceae bacterium]|nr:SRPBCC domain-containing protein [Polyangiaceae bacterium]